MMILLVLTFIFWIGFVLSTGLMLFLINESLKSQEEFNSQVIREISELKERKA